MIEVEQAVELLRNAVSVQQDIVDMPILEARDRILAKQLYSPIDIPHFPKAAMDGYALRSEDIKGACKESPVRLQVIGEVCPGDAKVYEGLPGTALRVMTGGAVPDGYDCVLKQEDSDYGMDSVLIYKSASPYENYCTIGEDLKKGDLVIALHTRLNSQHIGIIAGMGYTSVPVLRPFRVGIIATGNELIKPGTALGPVQVYNSSSFTIASYLKSAGVEVVFSDICGDDGEQFCKMLKEKINQVDAIITTGAVSVGKSDFMPAAMEQIGAELLFHRVHMKPGTPVMANLYQKKLILSLSGNPFAALVNFHLLFWPVLAKAMQNESFSWTYSKSILIEGSMKASGLRRFVRAYKDEEGVHLYTNDHRASVISNLAASNCIVDQPPNKVLGAGDSVNILFWKN